MATSRDIIGEIRKIGETLKPSDNNWDVVEITQLLKCLGLQLDVMDFAKAAPNGESASTAPKLAVEIRCDASGMVSKLTSSAPRCCVCPENTVANGSFWEVQAMAPSAWWATKEKSSNLLPEMAKTTNECAKILLDAALQLFKMPQSDVAPMIKIEQQSDGDLLNTSSTTQILSASPKDDVFLSNIRADNDRDIRIIQQLSEARYKMDQALLMLKFNGRTDALKNSLLMVTPQKPRAASSPASMKIGGLLNGSAKTGHGEKKPPGKLSLLPPKGDKIANHRRSVGSLVPPPPQGGGNVASGAKKKLTVKENVTSNLRRSMTLSQSMPKLPTSSKK